MSLEDIHRAVEAKREEHRRLGVEISQLLCMHNAYQPACRLPVEILSNIFLLCQRAGERRQQHAHPWTITSDPPDRAWLKLGSVCRRWRDILVSCPFLWTHISSSSLEWADLCIARSGRVSLRVASPRLHWKMFIHPYQKVLQAASTRIKTLEIDIPYNLNECIALRPGDSEEQVPMATILATGDCQLQALENLRIIFSEGFIDTSNILWPLSGQVQEYPNLRALYVDRVDWTSLRHLFRSTLTTLKVGNTMAATGINEWLRVLVGLPHLQELSMQRALCGQSNGEYTPVHLPCLRVLFLDSMDEDAGLYTSFWANLLLPNLTHVGIAMFWRFSNTQLVYPFIARKCLALHEKHRFLSARFSWAAQCLSTTVTQSEWTGHWPVLGLSSVETPLSRLASEHCYLDDAASAVFRAGFFVPYSAGDLLRRIPLSDITTLSIDYERHDTTVDPMLVDLWIPFFDGMPNLKALHIHNLNAVKGFLGMVRRGLGPDPVPGQSSNLFFPQLEYLTFAGIPWTIHVFKSEDDDSENRDDEYNNEDADGSQDDENEDRADDSDDSGGEGEDDGYNDENDEDHCDDFDPAGCACEDFELEEYDTHGPGREDPCTCRRDDLNTCLCADVEGSCDCECGWSREALDKLIGEVLRRRDMCGYRRLRRLLIVANQLLVDNRRGLRRYSSDIWGSLVEELDVRFDPPQ